MSQKRIKVLHVEDDPQDAELLQAAARQRAAPFEFSVATDGEAALTYLDSVQRGKKTRPDLMLLDLNLPKLDGLSVLKTVKSGPFKLIPVMVLSSSSRDSDVAGAYAAGTSIYFEKPTSMQGLYDLVAELGRLWSEFARLPPPVVLP